MASIATCPRCGESDYFIEGDNGLKCTNCNWEDENPEIEGTGDDQPDFDSMNFDGEVEATI